MLKKAALMMLVKIEDQNTVSSLTDQFNEMDRDGTGLLSKQDLKRAISECSIGIQENKIDKIMDEIDYFGNHEISYHEFLAATLDLKNSDHEKQISEIFHEFDCENTG